MDAQQAQTEQKIEARTARALKKFSLTYSKLEKSMRRYYVKRTAPREFLVWVWGYGSNDDTGALPLKVKSKIEEVSLLAGAERVYQDGEVVERNDANQVNSDPRIAFLSAKIRKSNGLFW